MLSFNGKYYSEGDKNLTSMLNFMLNFFLYIAKRTDHFILLFFFFGEDQSKICIIIYRLEYNACISTSIYFILG